MIDICFHNAVGGELLMTKSKLGIDYVFPLFLHLNYGYLSGDYIATQERMEADSLLYYYPNTSKQEIENNYNSGLHQARECLKKLDEMLAHGHNIRVWANNTAHDLDVQQFAVLETINDMLRYELVQTLVQGIGFKRCANCGMLFVPSGRSDSIYCDQKMDGETKPCNKIGANRKAKEKVAGARYSKSIEGPTSD